MKFNIGDKVIPIGNTIYGIKLEDTETWKKAKSINQPYLIIIKYDKKDNSYGCSLNKNDGLWYWWYEKDLRLYKDSKQLIKELYEI